MRVLPFISPGLCVLFLAGGCFHRPNHELPYVYQGWEARFQYDVDKRRLVPLYKNKQVGRSWGRNENGAVNYDRWMGENRFIGQDLLAFRRRKEEQEIRLRWREEQRVLMEAEREARKKAEEEDTGDPPEEPEETDDLGPLEPIPLEPLTPLQPLVPLEPLTPLEPVPETPDTSPPGGGPPPLPDPGGLPGGGGFTPLPEGMAPGGEAPPPLPALPDGANPDGANPAPPPNPFPALPPIP